MRIQVGTSLNQLFPFIINWLRLHPDTARITVLGISLVVLFALTYSLFKESREAFVLYVLVLFMSILWFANSDEFTARVIILDPLYSTLLHFSLLLILSCIIFYLAPKQSRELGFLIYGLAFSSPTFREVIKTLDKQFFALFFFIVTLVLIMNFSFTPNTFKAILETLLLSLFTVVSIGLNVYASVILPAFIIAFPKRHRRNYIYIGLTMMGIAVFSRVFGISFSTVLFNKSSLHMLVKFVKESLVQLVLFCYLFITNFRVAIRMRGQVLFLLILALTYLPLLTVYPWLFASLVIVTSALSIRLTQKLHLITQT